MQNKTKFFLSVAVVFVVGVLMVEKVTAEPSIPWCCVDSVGKSCLEITSKDICPGTGVSATTAACSTISTCPQYVPTSTTTTTTATTYWCCVPSTGNSCVSVVSPETCEGAGYATYTLNKAACSTVSTCSQYVSTSNVGVGTTSSSTGVIIPTTLSGLPTNTNLVKGIVTNIANWLLSIVGIIAVISFIISGIQYFLVATDEKMLETAKKTMMTSIIGIVVALFGYIAVKTIEMLLKG